MAFSEWCAPETISAICVGVGAIIAALGEAWRRNRKKGSSWKDVVLSMWKNEQQILKEVVEEKLIKPVNETKEKVKKQKENKEETKEELKV